MRIARPFALELDYTREMMVPLLLHGDDWPRKRVADRAGRRLGDQVPASPPAAGEAHRGRDRAARRSRGAAVLQAARRPGAHRHPPRRRRRLRGRSTKQRYDLILVDGFDADARTGRLDTLPFYLDCRARLADDGLLCVNLLSRRKDFRQSVKRLEEAFDGRAIAFPSCDSGNAIALGARRYLPARNPVRKAHQRRL
jgi:spermidine synthase